MLKSLSFSLFLLLFSSTFSHADYKTFFEIMDKKEKKDINLTDAYKEILNPTKLVFSSEPLKKFTPKQSKLLHTLLNHQEHVKYGYAYNFHNAWAGNKAEYLKVSASRKVNDKYLEHVAFLGLYSHLVDFTNKEIHFYEIMNSLVGFIKKNDFSGIKKLEFLGDFKNFVSEGDPDFSVYENTLNILLRKLNGNDIKTKDHKTLDQVFKDRITKEKQQFLTNKNKYKDLFSAHKAFIDFAKKYQDWTFDVKPLGKVSVPSKNEEGTDITIEEDRSYVAQVYLYKSGKQEEGKGELLDDTKTTDYIKTLEKEISAWDKNRLDWMEFIYNAGEVIQEKDNTEFSKAILEEHRRAEKYGVAAQKLTRELFLYRKLDIAKLLAIPTLRNEAVQKSRQDMAENDEIGITPTIIKLRSHYQRIKKIFDILNDISKYLPKVEGLKDLSFNETALFSKKYPNIDKLSKDIEELASLINEDTAKKKEEKLNNLLKGIKELSSLISKSQKDTKGKNLDKLSKDIEELASLINEDPAKKKEEKLNNLLKGIKELSSLISKSQKDMKDINLDKLSKEMEELSSLINKSEKDTKDINLDKLSKDIKELSSLISKSQKDTKDKNLDKLSKKMEELASLIIVELVSLIIEDTAKKKEADKPKLERTLSFQEKKGKFEHKEQKRTLTETKSFKPVIEWAKLKNQRLNEIESLKKDMHTRLEIIKGKIITIESNQGQKAKEPDAGQKDKKSKEEYLALINKANGHGIGNENGEDDDEANQNFLKEYEKNKKNRGKNKALTPQTVQKGNLGQSKAFLNLIKQDSSNSSKKTEEELRPPEEWD